ncbi:Tetraspannin, partial [Oryctes borbonicus]
FAALLFVILVAEIAATVWAYIYADALEPVVRGYVKSTVQEEYWHNADRQHTLDMIQRELKCCGTETPRDWIEDKDVVLVVSSSSAAKYLIPASCCRETVAPALCDHARKQIVAGTIDYNVIYDTGCVTKVANYIRDNLSVITGIGLGIIVVQAVGLIFALILTFAIGKNRRYKA